MTARGEILASYVTSEIPFGLSPQETIKRLRDQEAFISISHPFDSWRNGAWRLDYLIEIASLVDADEIFNARCMNPNGNQLASEFAQKHDITSTDGSDAHAAFELGAARLVIPKFSTADELRVVIRKGKVQRHLSHLWVHLFSQYANLHKKGV